MFQRISHIEEYLEYGLSTMCRRKAFFEQIIQGMCEQNIGNQLDSISKAILRWMVL